MVFVSISNSMVCSAIWELHKVCNFTRRLSQEWSSLRRGRATSKLSSVSLEPDDDTQAESL